MSCSACEIHPVGPFSSASKDMTLDVFSAWSQPPEDLTKQVEAS